MSTWLKKFYAHFSLFDKRAVTVNRKDCITCCVMASFDDPNFESDFFNPTMIGLVGRVMKDFDCVYSGLSIEEEKDTITFRVWR